MYSALKKWTVNRVFMRFSCTKGTIVISSFMAYFDHFKGVLLATEIELFIEWISMSTPHVGWYVGWWNLFNEHKLLTATCKLVSLKFRSL